MTEKKKQDNVLEWYVMRCRNVADFINGIEIYYNDEPEPMNRIEKYFIPVASFQSTQQQDKDKEHSAEERAQADVAMRKKEFRSALRHFVFLLIRPSGLDNLEHQSWNIGSNRLYHYRDFSGEEITVSDKMMTRFMDACAEYGDKMEICTVKRELETGIRVKMREGAFAGLEAEVVSIEYKSSGTRLTIAVKLFGKGDYAYIYNRTPDDVVISEKDSYAFTKDFMDRLEDNLLSIMKWHICKKEKDDSEPEKVAKKYDELIQGYFQLRNVGIKEPDQAVRFNTLMLYCAVLLKNTAAKTKYNKLLKSRMKEISASDLSDETEVRCRAYILAGLYFSTKDAEYRDKLKRTVREQLPPDDILRRHVAVLRNL